MFPALSRLKKDKEAYQDTFYSIQGAALSVLIPVGVGIFFYSQLVTDVFLGSNWGKAAFVISIYSLTRPLMICFNNFMSEVFRSNGHFYRSIFYQVAMLVFDVTLKFTVGRISYEWFIWTTVIANILTSIMAILILKFMYGFSMFKQWQSFFPAAICSALMIPMALLGSNLKSDMFQSMGQVLVCASFYFMILFMFFPKVFKNTMSFLVKKPKV